MILRFYKSLFPSRDNFLGKLFIIVLFNLLPAFFSTSCRVLRPDSKSIAEKKQKKADKEALAEFEKARKGHVKNQSKDTRKMMKSTRKKAGKYNGFKKRNGKGSNTCS